MKSTRRFFIALLFFLVTLSLAGCTQSRDDTINVNSIGIEPTSIDAVYLIDDFDLANIQLRVVLSDGTEEYHNIDASMLDEEQVALLTQEGTHTFTVRYRGQTTTFTVTLYREITMTLMSIYDEGVSEGLIDTTYEDWLQSIKGEDGASITDAHINTQGELILTLSTNETINAGVVKGEDGIHGIDGIDGDDGLSAYEIYLNHYPDYEKNETEWLNDLINGHLGEQDSFFLFLIPKGGLLDSIESYLVEVPKDQSVSLPAPEREGFIFTGWVENYDVDAPLYTDHIVLRKNTILYATWEAKTYTVSFETNTDELIQSIENIVHGSTITLPTPERDDHLFMGWYLGNSINDTQFFNSTRVQENLILHARWEPIEYPFIYYVENNEITIIGLIGGQQDAVIPSHMHGYPVTKLGAGSNLLGVEVLRTIHVPETVVEIGNYSFVPAKKLESVTFEENSQLKTIGLYAFSNTPIESIIIPSSVTLISDYAFYYTSSLHTVIFEQHSELTVIGIQAFFYSGLETIIIPASVQTIEMSAFRLSTYLNSIIFEENSQLQTIGAGAFSRTSIESILIPASVQVIGNSAFKDNTNLSSVSFEINSQLTTIGSEAFLYCELTSITIPSSVTTIGDSAFRNNLALHTVLFEENSQLESIPSYLFTLTSIVSITIPANVKTIEERAFNQVPLEYVYFEENSQLESIGREAFSICQSLKSVILPHGLLTIDTYAFRGNYNLQRVYIPSTVVLVGDEAFAETPKITIYIESSSAGAFWNPTWHGGYPVITNSRIIYFETNTHLEIDPLLASVGEPIIAPDIPIREGYTFVGWYTDETYSTLFEFDTMPDAHLTLYAKWEVIEE